MKPRRQRPYASASREEGDLLDGLTWRQRDALYRRRKEELLQIAALDNDPQSKIDADIRRLVRRLHV